MTGLDMTGLNFAFVLWIFIGLAAVRNHVRRRHQPDWLDMHRSKLFYSLVGLEAYSCGFMLENTCQTEQTTCERVQKGGVRRCSQMLCIIFA